MAILFLDTSALVKLYVREEGTDEMLRLSHPDLGNKLAILSVTRIEFRAAIRRRARLADIEQETANALIGQFVEHLSDMYLVQPLNETVLETASGVIDRHALRAYDGMQLAGCLTFRAAFGEDADMQFVSADDTLSCAARAEGLYVINPAQSPSL